MTVITPDLQKRVALAMQQMNESIHERTSVIHGAWVGRVAGLHVLMRGPGGTGKSMLQRTMCDHIKGAVRFEVAFDETTDPSQVFGPPDIKAMAEDGKVRRVTTGMLPEATDAFLDEFFNGNIPLLHSVMPVLNERLFHNNGMPQKTPLRQAIMGTNKLNLDPDLAALFDRVHIRYDVNYVTRRDNLRNMLISSVARLADKGRGAVTNSLEDRAIVSVDELDQAFEESLQLSVPDSALELLLDIREELKSNGIEVSDRRFNDGINAVLANAWIRNHEEVKPHDLDILAQMFWTHEEQIATARGVILGAASPGEKKALDLLDTLDEIKAELAKAGGDEDRQRRVAIEAVRNAEKVGREAEVERENALAAGGSVERLEEVIGKVQHFKAKTAQEMFGLTAGDQNTLGN